jgi:hypothetical protein
MLGIRVDALADGAVAPADDGWDEAQRQALQARISARTPFLDVRLSRRCDNGLHKEYRVSGTPMFDGACNFVGYRGFGVEIQG